jgi:hypothetical protein
MFSNSVYLLLPYFLVAACIWFFYRWRNLQRLLYQVQQINHMLLLRGGSTSSEFCVIWSQDCLSREDSKIVYDILYLPREFIAEIKQKGARNPTYNGMGADPQKIYRLLKKIDSGRATPKELEQLCEKAYAEHTEQQLKLPPLKL